jgi:hypothetical protein
MRALDFNDDDYRTIQSEARREWLQEQAEERKLAKLADEVLEESEDE